MNRYQRFVDFNCMPLPFGILCWLEDKLPFRDTEAIHQECPLTDECDLRHTADCKRRCHWDCAPDAWIQRDHRPARCPDEDWLCKLHDGTLNLLAFLRLPTLKGTWK